MTNQFNAEEIAEAANDLHDSVNNYPMSDNGYRFHVTMESLEYGPEFAEVGSSYFYLTDVDIAKAIENARFYSEKAGYDVRFRPVSKVYYDDANWPGTSWATVLVKVVDPSEIEAVCPRGQG